MVVWSKFCKLPKKQENLKVTVNFLVLQQISCGQVLRAVTRSGVDWKNGKIAGSHLLIPSSTIDIASMAP